MGTQARGFSLVELMVAVVIGLLVLAAVTTVMVNSKKNYTVQDSLARLQENARFAVDFLTRDLRMSGHFGCAHGPLNATRNRLDIAGSPLFDANVGLAGLDNMVVGTSEWHSFSPPATDVDEDKKIVPGTDAIVMRFMNGDSIPVIAPFMTAPTDPIMVAANNGRLNQGDIVLVADCSTADLFQVTSANPGVSGNVAHAAGVVGSPPIPPGNISDSFGDDPVKPKLYEGETETVIIGFTIARYFIGARDVKTGNICTADCACDSNHICGLFRKIGADDAQELVSGIESMQILYGVDTDPTPPPPQLPDYAPNVYVSADTVTAVGGWGKVTSVRIGLLAYTLASETESGEYGGVTDSGPYDVNGTAVSVTDGNLEAKRVKRRVFTTTVAVRNLRI
ncbi:MAG: hypothetical protein A2150_06715 [Candidatus Muproteobacteria bacterium RBG_16_64_11]|uniref:Prepilin-type N-terminal cleavage/methylation domain-containing protein n=1 Tax=Candidatus Muproteobacteria bacterium RBG_16_64_11 TaxID=1817758 RepID=A0A1F6TDX8_9PROT|nr:MAG: hypothetical protein A2150_06715 [Candidatus Muproteobacteria bacterium RBG_16_64_11]